MIILYSVRYPFVFNDYHFTSVAKRPKYLRASQLGWNKTIACKCGSLHHTQIQKGFQRTLFSAKSNRHKTKPQPDLTSYKKIDDRKVLLTNYSIMKSMIILKLFNCKNEITFKQVFIRQERHSSMHCLQSHHYDCLNFGNSQMHC